MQHESEEFCCRAPARKTDILLSSLVPDKHEPKVSKICDFSHMVCSVLFCSKRLFDSGHAVRTGSDATETSQLRQMQEVFVTFFCLMSCRKPF